MKRLFTIVGLASLALCACATRPQAPQSAPVATAIQQPFRDLSLIRDEVPEALVKAAESPYSLPQPLDCQTLFGEIAELNAALGPDVDVAPTKASRNAEELVGEAVRGAVGLPFRGVVRRVTGAEAHDRQLRRAVTAAVARRGFLRGVVLGRDCTAPPAG